MSNELLEGACSKIVTDTIAALGVQISAVLDPNLAEGSRALVQDMKQSGELVILLKPDRHDHQYLIAQGCLNALASKKEPFHLSSNPVGEAEFIETLASRGVGQPDVLANHLINGTGGQLRGMPLLALSAMTIFSDYPELRDDQLKYFKLDCAQGAHALTQVPPEFAGLILNAHWAMNGAIALVADFLFEQKNFFKPFIGHPIETVATALVDDLYGLQPKVPEVDILKSWIDKLSLENYFRVIEE